MFNNRINTLAKSKYELESNCMIHVKISMKRLRTTRTKGILSTNDKSSESCYSLDKPEPPLHQNIYVPVESGIELFRCTIKACQELHK